MSRFLCDSPSLTYLFILFQISEIGQMYYCLLILYANCTLMMMFIIPLSNFHVLYAHRKWQGMTMLGFLNEMCDIEKFICGS